MARFLEHVTLISSHLPHSHIHKSVLSQVHFLERASGQKYYNQ